MASSASTPLQASSSRRDTIGSGGSPTLESISAIYYPNRMNLIRFTLFGERYVTSHDEGCAAYEMRHMIDRDVLGSSVEGRLLLQTVIDAAALDESGPGIKVIKGACMDGVKVIGILTVPLDISLEDCVVTLDCVLVVDKLPVPCHISYTRLTKVTGTFQYHRRSATNTVNFDNKNIPEAYRLHPFWVNEGKDKHDPGKVQFVASLDFNSAHVQLSNLAKEAFALKGARDAVKYIYEAQRDDEANEEEVDSDDDWQEEIQLSRCGLCDKEEKVPHGFKKCSRCMVLTYCSPECQSEHWKIHKTICKSP